MGAEGRGPCEQLRTNRAGQEHLRSVTETLAGALRSNSARGVWGEVELRRVLEASGMLRHVDFVEQLSLTADGAGRPSRRAGGPGGGNSAGGETAGTDGPFGGWDAAAGGDAEGRAGAGRASTTAGRDGTRSAGGGRPDVVVRLPGEKSIVIDAKVPLSAYLEASAIPAGATGPQAARRQELVTAHARALRAHVDALARREYWAHLGDCPELTIMFIPAEGLLAAALEADPVLLEYALSRGVAPAAPATLLAVLRTVAVVWQQSTVTDDARALLELGRTLYRRLATLGGHVTRLGASLESAVAGYNRMVGSLESRVLATARTFEALDDTRLEVGPLNRSCCVSGSEPVGACSGCSWPSERW